MHVYGGTALIYDDNTVLLQQRDNRPGIRDPGMISTFGGAAEMGESPLQCAQRELNEELRISLASHMFKPLIELTKIEDDGTLTHCFFFYVVISDSQLVEVQEGSAIRLGLNDALEHSRITPACKDVINALKERRVAEDGL